MLGWAGSLTNHPGKRGVEDYIIPAVEGLKGVTLTLAAREHKWRTQKEMVRFYQKLDALICASRTEGGPHSLLEAAACGIPLISTRVGIAPELIKDGENGLLIERSIKAIRNAVIKLRDNQELRIAMGKRARETVVKTHGAGTCRHKTMYRSLTMGLAHQMQTHETRQNDSYNYVLLTVVLWLTLVGMFIRIWGLWDYALSPDDAISASVSIGEGLHDVWNTLRYQKYRSASRLKTG